MTFLARLPHTLERFLDWWIILVFAAKLMDLWLRGVHLFQLEGIESTQLLVETNQLCLFPRIVKEIDWMESVSDSNNWKEVPSLFIPHSLSRTTSAPKNLKDNLEESIEPMIEDVSDHEKRRIQVVPGLEEDRF